MILALSLWLMAGSALIGNQSAPVNQVETIEVEGTVAETQSDPLLACQPTMYTCESAEELSQQAAYNDAAACARDSGACWYAPDCYRWTIIKTSPEKYVCDLYYKTY